MDESVSLEELLQRESAWVEWKKNGDPLDIVAKLVAFANDVGDRRQRGCVICGVEEVKDEHGVVRSNIVGITQGELNALKGKVLDTCVNYVSPPLHPDVVVTELQLEPPRFVLQFWASPTGRVHSHDTKQGSKVWVLRDSHTYEAKGEELRELHARRGVIPHLLERLAYNDSLGKYATLDDIYMTAADEFRRQAKLPRPTADYFIPNEPLDANTLALCTTVEVAPGKTVVVPRLLAILLFGHTPGKFIRGAFAIVSVYPGTKRTTPYSARTEFSGPLTKVINDVIEKLKGYMGVFMDKTQSGLRIRQNRNMYSETAVQEVVLNAFAHRDYEVYEPIHITVFSDRIEVVSPGALINGIDPEKLRRGQSVGSRWRNRALAGFLQRMRLGVQAEGQGIPKVYEETLDTAERPPEYEFNSAQVVVTIPAYYPVPISFHEPPPPPPSPPPVDLRHGILLISIGGPSLLSSVEPSLERLGLGAGEIVADISMKEYIEAGADSWTDIAKKVYRVVAQCVENQAYSHLHLFYRGPNLIGPVIGAAVANIKPLVVYSYFESRYERAYTLDRRFLRKDS